MGKLKLFGAALAGTLLIASAANAQAYKVGDTLPNGGKVTSLGVGPKGNPVYNTSKGMILQSAVKPAAAPIAQQPKSDEKLKPTPASMTMPKPSSTPKWDRMKNRP